MIKTKNKNDEVLYPVEEIVRVSGQDLSGLKQMAQKNPRQRIRLCTHKAEEDDVHEMLIFHPEGAYVPPHKHIGKEESFHIISGAVDCIIFDEDGNVVTVFPMGDYASREIFYCRIPIGKFHTQIFREDTFFHEVTKGPFSLNDTVNADWAPSSLDVKSAAQFMKKIRSQMYEVIEEK